MGPEVIAAYFAGAALIIAAIGNLIVNILNSRKLTEIHTVTNSGLTAARDELKVQNEHVVRLEKQITSMQSAMGVKAAVHAEMRESNE